jgi:hypothetical protein
MKLHQIYSALLSFSLVGFIAGNQETTASNVAKNKSENNRQKLDVQAIAIIFDSLNKYRGLFQKFQDIRHMSPRVKIGLIALAEEEVRLENEMRMEQEKREKIYRQHLASRVQSSIMRDFLTSRY